MKTKLQFVLGFLALAGAYSAVAADYPNAILADGPVAYYRFGESVTAPVFDYATNSGTFGASALSKYIRVGHSAAGALVGEPGNRSVSIPNLNNGASCRVRVPYQPALNQIAPFSVEFWAKPSKLSDLGCAAGSADFNIATRFGWLIYQGNSGLTDGNGWYFRIYRTGGANTAAFINTPVNTNHWYHIVGTFDGTTTMKLYVDGTPVATNTLAGTYTPNTNALVPLTFGGRGDGAAGFFGWGGLMDEAAYYTNALSAGDVLAHYQNGTNASPGTPYATLVQSLNPAVYLRLNEANPFPVAVNAGTAGAGANGAYDGAVSDAGPSSPAFPGFEINNSAGYFDGTNGSIQIPNFSSLNFTGAITLAAWIRPTNSDTTLQNIISHGYFDAEVQIRRNAGNWEWGTWPVGGGTPGSPVPPEDINNWTFLAGTWDGANVKLFRNGAEMTSAAQTTGSLLVNAPWGIGARGGEFNDGRFFTGQIDEAAIFNKSMSPGHILSLYFAAIGSNSPPFMVTDPPTLDPNTTIYATTPFSITPNVAGTLPLTYQWRRFGTNLPGTPTEIFSKAAAAVSDSGPYELVTTNSFGAVTSQVVFVTVDPAVPPSVVQDPASRLVYAGGQASFTVVASGTTLSYQWKLAGTNLAGATSSKLYVTNCTVAELGAYTVGVSNVTGGVLSAPANLAFKVPVAGSYEEAVVAFKPLAYWRLNDSNGLTAFDYMGGYDATLAGVVAVANPGPSGPQYPGFGADNADYVFDGFSGSFQVGNPAGLNFAGQITLGAWVLSSSSDAQLRNVLSHGYTTSPNGEVQLRRNGNQYDVGSWPTGGGAAAALKPEDVGNWVFLVGTHDGTNWRLYRNGVLIGTTAGSGPILVNAGWGIGARGDSTSDNRIFAGEIDEAMIFNKALTGQEICSLYNRAVGYTGSVNARATILAGTGYSSLVTETFVSDGGFTYFSANPTPETDWSYTGTAWYTPGQASSFGGDNATYLTSPPYTATKAGAVKLSLTHRYSFENDGTAYDGGAIEVSVNGGAFVRVPPLAFELNGYNGIGGNALTLFNQPCFVANSPGHPAFITSSCTVAGVQPGDTIRLRFIADYDNNTTGDGTPPGWEIDGFQLLEGGSGPLAIACPCGTLQQRTNVTTGTWTDTGNPVVLDPKTNPQRYFRVRP